MLLCRRFRSHTETPHEPTYAEIISAAMYAGIFPPYQRYSGTSHAAALAIAPRAFTLRAEVLRVIAEAQQYGATDEEICRTLRMGGSTERPRRIELVEGGFVVDSSVRRETRSGRKAVVWITNRLSGTTS